MNKTMYRIMSMLMALSLTLGIFTPGRAESKLGALMSGGTVNLAHFYKPPSNSDAANGARNFSSIVLTGGDESFRDQLVANGLTHGHTIFCSVGIRIPQLHLRPKQSGCL
jgi:hypothetical protein